MTEDPKPEVSFGEFTAFNPNVTVYSVGAISQSVLDDNAWVRQVFGTSASWERPDRNPFPHIDPTPRLSASLAWLTEARDRIEYAWEVLRDGIPNPDDYV